MAKALTSAIARVGLVGIDAEVLRYLVREPLGIREEAFGSILASRTQRSPSECVAAAARLLARNFIAPRREDGVCRYLANMAALPLDRAALNELATLARSSALQMLGPPHGENAMRSLSSILLNERRPIFIALDITGHDVFNELEQRARNGLRTTFLAPDRGAVPEHLRKHWKDVYSVWAHWLNGSERVIRQNVSLLLTPRHYTHLSTSLATEDFVRFDVYWTQDNTTRNGEMVLAPKGTSLYDIIRAQYEDAYATADPYWRAAPGQWAVAKARRWVVPVVVVAALVVVTYWAASQGTDAERISFSLASVDGLIRPTMDV